MYVSAQSCGRAGAHYERNFCEVLETVMSIGTIILILLVLVLIGVVPAWPHSRAWGYGPTGGIGLIVAVLLILLLMGRL